MCAGRCSCERALSEGCPFPCWAVTQHCGLGYCQGRCCKSQHAEASGSSVSLFTRCLLHEAGDVESGAAFHWTRFLVHQRSRFLSTSFVSSSTTTGGLTHWVLAGVRPPTLPCGERVPSQHTLSVMNGDIVGLLKLLKTVRAPVCWLSSRRSLLSRSTTIKGKNNIMRERIWFNCVATTH